MELVAAKFGTPMPSYRQELLASQLHAIRSACLLAAPLLLAFSLLDRALAPGSWVLLLVIRVVVALALLGCARAAERQDASPLALVAAATALIAGTLDAALIRTGGAESPYLYSMMIVQAGVSMLVPLRMKQALLINLEILAL